MLTKEKITALINRLIDIRFMLLSSIIDNETFHHWLITTYADKPKEGEIPRQLKKFQHAFAEVIATTQANHPTIDIVEQFNKAMLGDPDAWIPALQRKDTPREPEESAHEYEGFVACQSKREWQANGALVEVRRKTKKATALLNKFLSDYQPIAIFLLDELRQIEPIGQTYQQYIYDKLEQYKKNADQEKRMRRNPAAADDSTDVETEEENPTAVATPTRALCSASASPHTQQAKSITPVKENLVTGRSTTLLSFPHLKARARPAAAETQTLMAAVATVVTERPRRVLPAFLCPTSATTEKAPNSKRKQPGAQRLQRKKSDHKKEGEFGITYDGVSALLDKPLPPHGPS